MLVLALIVAVILIVEFAAARWGYDSRDIALLDRFEDRR
jgi:hypothetical protein